MTRGRTAGARAVESGPKSKKRAKRNRDVGTGPTHDSRETRPLDFRSSHTDHRDAILYRSSSRARSTARRLASTLASTSYKTRVCPRGARSRPPFPGSLEKKRDQLSKGKNPPHDAHLTFLFSSPTPTTTSPDPAHRAHRR